MKKILFSLVAVSFLLADEVIDISQTPKEILSFVKEHYPSLKITQVQKDTDEYEILTNDNTKLEFNANSSLKSISSTKQIPDNILPKNILDYIKKNYPNNFIIEYEKDDEIEIELNNKINLEFDLNGNFLRID